MRPSPCSSGPTRRSINRGNTVDTIVALVITISTLVGGTSTRSVVSAYSIPGFQTVAACEKAKKLEVERMEKTMTRLDGKVTGECREYPSK